MLASYFLRMLDMRDEEARSVKEIPGQSKVPFSIRERDSVDKTWLRSLRRKEQRA
jgi:hypothetical protein